MSFFWVLPQPLFFHSCSYCMTRFCFYLSVVAANTGTLIAYCKSLRGCMGHLRQAQRHDRQVARPDQHVVGRDVVLVGRQ